MHRLLLITGLLLLMTVWIINRFIASRKAARSGAILRYRRLRCARRCLQRLRKTTRLRDDLPASSALQDCAPLLMTALRRLSLRMRRMPALPAGEDHQPRLMQLAHELSDEGQYEAAELLHALSNWQAFDFMSSEVEQLPLCIAAAQCQRLNRVLRSIRTDILESRTARRRYRQLRRTKDPHKFLDKYPLSTSGLASLRRVCEQHNSPFLAIVDAWLMAQGITPEALMMHAQEHQAQPSEELLRALDCFLRLERLDWAAHSESADPLHPLFMLDPSGAYPRLDAASRRYLRRRLEIFSRRTGIDARLILRQALTLSESAKDITPDGCLCWYLLEAAGLRRLHRALPCRSSWLWAHFSRCTDLLSYGFLLLFGIVTGFLFLNSRQPVFMLPFFALAAGCISRGLLQLLPRPPLLHMTLPQDDSLETLVVLPAELAAPAHVLHAIQAAKSTLRFLPENAHLLLLGDFAPSITAVSGSDAAVVQTAAAAVASLNDPRVFYLQRHRVWNNEQHCYCSLGGSSGAVFDLCRMISRGESEAPMAYLSIDSSAWERRYAYLFLLPPVQMMPPGILEQLLCVMISPLCTRLSTPAGWRGASILTPQGMSFSDGMALLQPDAFLEATDGLIQPGPSADMLCEALSGHVSVPGVRTKVKDHALSWEEFCRQATFIWQLLPWQLTHVQTPSGLISNPLRFLSRFMLRECLRKTLIPLGRLVLLAWAVLTNSWPLFLLSLACTEFSSPPRSKADLQRFFTRLSLLPMTAAMNLLGAFRALFRKWRKNPDFTAIEVWVQGIAATLFAGLGFALPGGSLPSLLLAAVFAAFPLAHKCK